MLAAVLSSVAVGVLTHLWDLPVHVPFQYAHAPGDDEEDATLDLMLIKNVHETGWFNTNPKLNAPFEQQWAEWPMGGDLLAYTIKKGIVDATGDVPLTFNLFWLLTFPLTAMAAFPVLRKLRVSWSAALVGAVLYSLAPYHFRNGAGHENLAFYVGVPIIVLLCMRVLGPDDALPRVRDLTGVAAWKQLGWMAVGTVLIAVTGIYYLAFLLCLLGICAVISVLAGRKVGRLAIAAILGAVGLLASTVANLPTLLYRFQHPANLLGVPDRRLGVAEIYPLRIVELFSPVTGHRFGPFAFIADQLYAPGHRGPGTAVLGIAASVGVVVAFFAAVTRAVRRPPHGSWSFEARIGIVIVSALVLATGGGLSRALELVGLSGIRAWSRIAIVIAFAGIVVFARLLDRARIAVARPRSRARRVIPRAAWATGGALIIVLGALDQVSPASLPKPQDHAALWRRDGAFVATLERRLPKNAMVFQLPVADFPEHGTIAELSAHDLIKEGYLHSKTLRWSAGGIRGRSGEWQWPAFNLTTHSLARGLAAIGFSAITVDRNGFSDHGDHRVAALTTLLGPPFADDGAHLLAWDLRPARSTLLPGLSGQQRHRVALRMLNAPRIYLSTDVDPIRNRGTNQPICATGTALIVNPSHHQVDVRLGVTLTPKGEVNPVGHVTVQGRSVATPVAPPPREFHLVLAAGTTPVAITIETPDVRCASTQLDQLTTVSVSLPTH